MTESSRRVDDFSSLLSMSTKIGKYVCMYVCRELTSTCSFIPRHSAM